jgi:uncharacterized surface protein with fasciclin (FAS1) repeats
LRKASDTFVFQAGGLNIFFLHQKSIGPPDCVHPADNPQFLGIREGRKGSKMKKTLSILLAVAALTTAASTALAQNANPMVGGAAMFRTKDIVDNAVNSADHTTLVAAVKAAGLVATLKSKGPFTVFAPTNAAFDKLPAGTVETLVKPENKEMLTRILTYHVVAGNYDSKKLMKLINKGGGTATLKTVSGDTLMAMMSGNQLVLRDEKGNTSNVQITDVRQSNGVIHVIDTVIMPN